MLKAILIDADGIVIQGRQKYFSEILSEKQGVELEVVLDFFKKDYKKCVLGQADLKQEVAKYLDKWKWQGTTDELLSFWFSKDGHPSPEILDVVEQLRSQSLKAYIASDHSQYRAHDILQNMNLKEYFDGSFFSCNLGTTKKDSAFYIQAAQELGLDPNEIMFWDDEMENVEATKNAGCMAYFYEGLTEFVTDLKKELNVKII